MTSLVPIGYLDRIRDRACKQRVIVTPAHELGPRYRYGMFSQKSRAYDYRDPSILTLAKYNTNTHGNKIFMYEGATLWNSISNGMKTTEN